MAEQKVLADLAARCLAGDAAAWEKLVAGQQRRVYGICYRFTGSPTEAEDMTQDVFLKMYRNLASFDPSRGGFTTWLTTLTAQPAGGQLPPHPHGPRQRLARRKPSTAETTALPRPSVSWTVAAPRSSMSPVSSSGRRSRPRSSRFPPSCARPLFSATLEDMDYKEIAEVLGVPQGHREKPD